MGSGDREMREDKPEGETGRSEEGVLERARQLKKCIFVQARAFEWVQDKVGDYERSEETL